ncbi:flagellar basal body rod protein FlgB [Meridianimarinicoccus roseus]|jgi:flagellar basal-body rod protein FlgB|uniref:Flagellar basal body rod protein FlgB n=1 Tax=Meridianimarinicoccus roseus TaxID=2072018 RepID=A0A2V2LLB5_9RHOB|nr:flagellar basal body rod protein FlgB [Meridianimarinicoccus roseus]PWR02573.1 flagellar basal body rod protein FlgB [Meridianimarinicoccus roseus]
MTGIREHLGIHADALILRERRNEVLASNIANAATPHFKARDFDFAAELQRAAGGGPLAVTNAAHIVHGDAPAGQMGYRVPVNPSLDGNTVEMPVEQMEFSENTVRYQTSLELLNRKISGLTRAIRGE